MNSDYATILENAGADEFAAEGTQGHALYQLQRRIAELVAADVEHDRAKAEQEDTAKFDEDGMYVPRAVFERMAAATTRRAAALAAVRGGAK